MAYQMTLSDLYGLSLIAGLFTCSFFPAWIYANAVYAFIVYPTICLYVWHRWHRVWTFDPTRGHWPGD